MDEKMKQAFRISTSVAIMLGLMTAGEYWLGIVANKWWSILLAIAALKAFFVVRDYMNIGRLFRSEEEH